MKHFLLLAICSLTVAVPLRPLSKPISESLTESSRVPNITTTSSKPSPSINSTIAVPITFPNTENSIVLNQNETSKSSTIVFLNTTTEESIMNQTATIPLGTEEISTILENQMIEKTEVSSGQNLTTITTEAKPNVKETSNIQNTSTKEVTTTSFETEGSSDESSTTITSTEATTTIVIEELTTVSETTTSVPLITTKTIETTTVNNSSLSETADTTTKSIQITTFVLEEVVKHEVEQVFSVFGPYVLALTVVSSIFLTVSVVFRLKRSRKLRGGYSPAMEETYSTATYSLHTEFIFKDERLI